MRFPHYDLFIIALGPLIALGLLVSSATARATGRIIRAAALDREMLGALGTNVSSLYTGMFVLAAFLAGLVGALVTPIKSVVPGMDVEIIIEAFIVVVIGGLGSLWGTLLGSLIYGLHSRLRHPDLPALLDLRRVRDHGRRADRAAVGPAGEAREVRRMPQAHPLDARAVPVAALIPVLGSRYYTFLATDIVIFAVFATSLNLLLGYTGLVSFGHAAYFGVGAYVCAHLHEGARHAVPAGLAARRRRRRAVRAQSSASSACA